MENKKTKKGKILQCPACRNGYSKADISIVKRLEDKTVFHLTCQKCRSKSLNVLSIGSQGIMGVGMMTDLDRDEAVDKINCKAICADDVIDAHESLRTTE